MLLITLSGLDGCGKSTHAAHLAEHLAIRSTDPDTLEVDGVSFNGETQGSTLRLEAIGPPEAWPSMVARLARWMDAREVDADVLEVERGRILMEVASTAPLRARANRQI